MKKIISILLLSHLFISVTFAQRNYTQELAYLMQQGRCFEAREFRVQYSDKLPSNDKALGLFYKFHMALFFNKPDSAAIYLEDLLANRDFELKQGPWIGTYYGRLFKIYENEQRFEDGINSCDKFLDYLNRNPFDLKPDFIRKEINFAENIKSSFKNREMDEPRMGIERQECSENDIIELKNDEYIKFDAKYNDVTIQTWFDTGVEAYFVTTRKLADEIGTKKSLKEQDSIQMVNGVPRRVVLEIIDSINLKNVRLYNVPVLVYEESFLVHDLPDTLNNEIKLNIKRAFSDNQIIMGLPAMKRIGEIAFDGEKGTMSFPDNTEPVRSNDYSNIFIVGDTPYIRFKINGLNCTGFLDTGDNCFLDLTNSFYEKNKNNLKIDSTANKEPYHHHTITGNEFDIPYEYAKDAKVYSNGRLVNEVKRIMITERDIRRNILDGVVGVHFIKQLGKRVLFDFNNMRVRATN
jgi:hypothetical protein